MLSEKLKLFKTDRKWWNKEIFSSLEENLEAKRSEINLLNIIDDTLGLEEDEIITRY